MDSQATVSIVLEAMQKGQQAYSEAAKQLDKVNAAANQNTTIMSRFGSVVGSAVATALKAIGGLVAAFILLNRHLLEDIDSLSKLARALEVPTEKLSRLMNAARSSGGDTRQLAVALNQLQLALAEAADPMSKSAETFREIGIRTKDANGNTKDAVTVFRELADVFATHSGAADKSRIATDLLGGKSRELMEMLNGGSAAIDANADKFEALGTTISTETGKQVEALNDNIGILKETFNGMSIQLLEMLLPAMTEITQVVIDFAAKNDFARESARTLADIIVFLAKTAIFLGTGFRACQIVLAELVGLTVANARTEFQGLIDLITALIKGLWSMGEAIIEVIRKFGAFGDVVKLALAGDFKGAADAAKAALVGIADAEAEVFKQGWETAKAAGKVVQDTVVEVAGNVIETAKSAYQQLQDLQTNSLALLNAADSKVAKDPKSKATAGEWQGPMPDKKPIIDHSFAGDFRKEYVSMLKEFGTVAHSAAQTIGNAFRGVFSSISSGISGIIKGTETWAGLLNNIANSVLDAVIDGIVKMAASWITQRLIMSQVSKAASVAEGATDATAKAPGAILTSISSWGVAAAVGIAAVIAALALSGGFEQGGYTGDGASNAPAGVVHRGEVVIPKGIVQKHGIGHFAEYFGGTMPGYAGGGYERGGLVTLPPGGGQAAVGAAMKPQINIGLISNRQDERDMLARDAGAQIVNRLQRRGNRFKA